MTRSKKSSAEWIQLTLRSLPEEREALWAVLYDYQCVGLEERDPESCVAFFSMDLNREALLDTLRALPFVHAIQDTVIPTENWHANWLESYRSFRVGAFFIRPSWRDEITPPGAVELVMDPKGAFGTGTHATTQLCLQALPGVVPGKCCMVDVGCGSGILSIAARKLSPGMRLLALDNDPEAVPVCRENAAINQVTFEIVCGTFATTRHSVDLIVANLQRDVLVECMPEFADRTRPEGVLLLSGILDEQVSEIRTAYAPAFDLQNISSQDEWVAMRYRRI